MVEPQLFIIASVICGGRIISGSAGTRFWVHRLGYVSQFPRHSVLVLSTVLIYVEGLAGKRYHSQI